MSTNLTNEELLDRLYQEAKTLNLDALENYYPQQLKELQAPQLRLELPFKKNYQLQELLQFQGDSFIHNAYRALLHRNPDQAGLESWQAYRKTEPRKTQLLLALAASQEAQEKGVTLEGLDYFAQLKNSRLARHLPQLADWLATRKDRQLNRQARQFLAEPLEDLLASQAAQVESLTNNLNELFFAPKSQLHLQESRLRYLEYLQTLQPQPTAAQQPAPNSTANPALDAFYLAFEQACRTSSEQLKQHFQIYLPYLPANPANSPVLDIGCGRGEWLEFLKQHGYPAQGIEISPVMQDYCQRKGLVVECTDTLQWLKQQPDASFAAITAFQVAEHLPFELLFALVNEAKRLLKPNGLLLLETPNPENLLVGSHTFYHDPTHRNPLTPTLMQFLADYTGYQQIQILRSNSYPAEALLPGDDPTTQRLNGHLGGAQDFALLARAPETGS